MKIQPPEMPEWLVLPPLGPGGEGPGGPGLVVVVPGPGGAGDPEQACEVWKLIINKQLSESSWKPLNFPISSESQIKFILVFRGEPRQGSPFWKESVKPSFPEAPALGSRASAVTPSHFASMSQHTACCPGSPPI